MIAAVCIDDRGGMMFNRRRQSQDRALRRDLLSMAGVRTLWMNEYSARQFQPEDQNRLTIAEDFLERAGVGELCFVENQPLAPWLEKLEAVVVYCWNRTYPADRYLDLVLAEPDWRMAEHCEFTGFSHEKITKEIYSK